MKRQTYPLTTLPVVVGVFSAPSTEHSTGTTKPTGFRKR